MRTALGVLAVALLAGCGADEATEISGAPSSSTSEATVATTPQEQRVSIVVVEVVGDQLLSVTTEPVPTDDGPPECKPTISTSVTEGEQLDVSVTALAAVRYPWDGCSLAARTLEVALSTPHAGRAILDGIGTTFVLYEGVYTACPPEGQSCNPAPAACGDATLRDAIANADVPAHFDMTNLRCEDPFAVVDVDLGAGACPPQEGQPNPCGGMRVDRMFWQIVDGRWVLLARGRSASCADVIPVASEFPTELCADLGAIPDPPPQ